MNCKLVRNDHRWSEFMSDYTWLTDLFASAATMQAGITAPAFVSANVSVVTNEMGGTVVAGGTVTQAAGSVVYVPAAAAGWGGGGGSSAGGGQALLTSKAAGPTQFYNSLFRMKLGSVIDQVTLSISKPASSSSAPVVVIGYLDIYGNPTIAAQTLTGVGTAARVLYGVAADGIATAMNPNGTNALFAIAPFNLQVQPGT
jgi:hypothetical protein